MKSRSKVDLHCLCWNEARIIPFFLRHYLPLVDRVFVFDNGSTDQSLALLSGDERIVVSHFDVRGDSFVDEERLLSDTMWKASRDTADWVAVVDMDEHIHHPDLPTYLASCRRAGVTAIQAIGYEMVADEFPAPTAVLTETVTHGFRYKDSLDKFCLFDPGAITESRYHAGRHGASPEGRVVWEPDRSVMLLHYKQLGLDYFIKRTAELKTGLRAGDWKNGWGAHYNRGPVRLMQDFLRHKSMAQPVPGLTARQAEPGIHLLVHGTRIVPSEVENNRLRFTLPSGTTAVRIVSPRASASMPVVGVSVEGLILYHEDEQRDIPLDSPHLREGWWGPTRLEDRVTRWTDGNALMVMPLALSAACILEVRLTSHLADAGTR